LPEDKPSEKVEDKFKLSLLQIEKRFVDLEVAIGELNEKLKDVDTKAVSELKQRIEDIEDLIMVEQAGVIELKKMLEEVQKRAETQKAAPQAVSISSEEVKKITSEVVSEIEARLEKIEKNIESIITETSNIRTEVNNEIRKMKERIGSAPLYADMQFITNRVKDLKNTVDSLLNMKVEIDSKILNLERSLVEMSEKEGISPNILKEIDNMTLKIGSLEKTIQEVSEKIKFLDQSEIEKSMKIVKDLESSYSNIYLRFNQLYGEVQKKIEDMSKIELKFKESMKDSQERMVKLENSLKEFRSLVETSRKELDERISKVELTELPTQVLELNKKIKDIESRMDVVETFTKDFDKKISKIELPTEIMDKQINELLGKIVLLETRLVTLEKMFQQQLAKVEPIILE
jgi:chromosome segregation ATPase